MRSALIALVLLAACAQTPPPAANTPPAATPPNTAEEATAQDTCGASRFRQLIGTQASAIDRASLPAATRVIMPGQMITMDFRADRLNIRVGPDGKVTEIGCF